MGCLEQALDLISEGFSVIPLKPRSKEPALASWKEFQTRIATEAEVRAWFADPEMNLGIVTGPISGNLAVVDADSPVAAANWYERHKYQVLGAPVVQTGRKEIGYHTYLRTDIPVPCQKRDGLDIKGTGGYVVAPPSIHPSGAEYKVVEGDLMKIPVVSAFELGLLPEPGEGDRSSAPNLEEHVRSGARNATMTSLAGTLRRRGMTVEQIVVQLSAFYEQNCDHEPPIDQTEIRRIAESIDRIHERNYPQANTSEELEYRLYAIEELELSLPEWLIKGYLETDQFAELFGDPGHYKTFVAVDWACCVASGTPWCGCKVKQGPVVYVAGEGQRSWRRRVKAWELYHNVDLRGSPLRLVRRPAQLTNPQAMAKLHKAIEAAAEKIGLPVLIVFDTLARNFGPGDESKPADMNLAVAAADELRVRWGGCVLFVHHPGHADKFRGRGGSSLGGALDSDFRVSKDDENTVRIEATKTKDGPAPLPKAFKVEDVDLGLVDEDGVGINSCVLVETAYSPEESTKAKAGGGAQRRRMVELLQRLIAKRERDLECRGEDPEAARVTIDEWRAVCAEAGVPNTTFYRNRDDLLKFKEVRIEYGCVFPS